MQLIIGKRKRYTEEFKQAAIEKLTSGNYTLRQLSSELHVSVPTLLKWRRDGRSTEGTSQDPADRDSEIARLRREIERLVEERDRLRKGIAVLVGVAV